MATPRLQAGYSFCSTSAKAIERNEVSLAGYSAVDLILGKQRTTTTGRGTRGTEFRTFTPEMQQALRELADAGGNLFISGSYVLSDLEQSSEADKMTMNSPNGYCTQHSTATNLLCKDVCESSLHLPTNSHAANIVTTSNWGPTIMPSKHPMPCNQSAMRQSPSCVMPTPVEQPVLLRPDADGHSSWAFRSKQCKPPVNESD